MTRDNGRSGRTPDRSRVALGAFGERLAVRHLLAAGLEVLDRNWRCREGEIDIVARDGSCLVVCEVKTRRTLDYGHPLEAVTWRKAARLRRLAGWWLVEHVAERAATRDVRVDVVGVIVPFHGAPTVEHIPAVLA